MNKKQEALSEIITRLKPFVDPTIGKQPSNMSLADGQLAQAIIDLCEVLFHA